MSRAHWPSLSSPAQLSAQSSVVVPDLSARRRIVTSSATIAPSCSTGASSEAIAGSGAGAAAPSASRTGSAATRSQWCMKIPFSVPAADVSPQSLTGG
jgi:hypothetical protein